MITLRQVKQIVIAVFGFFMTSCSSTPAEQNFVENLGQTDANADPISLVEPTASEPFRLLMDEVEVCRNIMLNDDWSGLKGREEVIIDAGRSGKYPYTRVRAFVADNGLTQIFLTDIPQSAEDDGPLIFCRSTTLEPQATATRVALHIEFDQWVDSIKSSPGIKGVSWETSGPLQAAAVWCESESPVAVLVPPGREQQPEAFAIAVTTGRPIDLLFKGFVCPVNLDAIQESERESTSERVTAFMENQLLRDATVTLEQCNLSIMLETASKRQKDPLPFTRVVQSADLSMYKLDDIRIIRGDSGAKLRIKRKSVNERMVDQAQLVFKGAEKLGLRKLTERDFIQDSLGNTNHELFLRLTGEAMIENNKLTPIPLEDAPVFYEYLQRIEALPAPSSYMVQMSFSKRSASANSLISGEIIALPPLQFSANSLAQAENIAGGIIEYARENKCL